MEKEMKYHEMTKDEIRAAFKKLYFSQPKANWDALKVGDIIMYDFRGWTITKIPPKRGWVIGKSFLSGEEEKLPRSRYDNSNLLITDQTTVDTLKTIHREELEKAKNKGIAIAPRIQYDYPDLFTPFPSYWTDKQRQHAQDLWSRMNEMRHFLDNQHGERKWIVQKVDDFIAQNEQYIRDWEAYIVDVKAGKGIKKPEVIPDIVARTENNIKETQDEIEILRHLRNHAQKVAA
jgi:hypothetical protein